MIDFSCLPLTTLKYHQKFVKIPLSIQFFLNFQNMCFLQLITNDFIPIPTFKFDLFEDNEKKKTASSKKVEEKLTKICENSN